MIPECPDVERALAGVCVASHKGYRLAMKRITPAAFYVPELRRLVEACSYLADLSGIDDDSLRQRIFQAADLAGAPARTVARLVQERDVQWDTAGALADQVARAYRARQALAIGEDLRKRITAAEPLDRVLVAARTALDDLIPTSTP